MRRPIGRILLTLLTLTMIACEPTIEDTLREQARNPVTDVRAHVARHPQAPAKVLEELSRDPEIVVRVLVAQNQNTSSSVLESMLEQSLGVYENRRAPTWSFEVQIIGLAIVHPNSPKGTLDLVATNAPGVLKRLIDESPGALPPERLAALASYEALHSSLVGNPNTPMEVVQQLRNAVPEDEFRRAMLDRDDVDPQWLVSLYESAAGERERVVDEMIEKERQRDNIANTKGRTFGLIESIARNPNASPDLLRRIGEADLGILTRCCPVSYRGRYTGEVTTSLRFEYTYLLALDAVAANPNTPRDLLEQLESFEYEPDGFFARDVREAVAANTSLAQ